MKIKQLVLGMTLAATTLASVATIPALAGDSPKFDDQYSTQGYHEQNLDKAHGKRRCFFKRVRVFKHGRYFYVVRKVCRFRRH
ncbi:hypothetical protein [Merismopedia glauca]|uniref:Uncharacterized protein n=1 Tax=Merismopedia glauca CCAP 1448/3 TaxID=1296344 RepID=A0A2T1C6Q4_9CYAN|nr:hypothetical protein [Merismopedia glauca]PSB03823.1 hypothetical protein C7B64_06860 [Merismopedia glauca CCAP 1448/3]